MFQLYRGERKFCQNVFVSPVMLVVSLLFSSEISSFYTVLLDFIGFELTSFSFFFWQGKSLRFSGYQIAHTIIGKRYYYLFSYSVMLLSSLL